MLHMKPNQISFECSRFILIDQRKSLIRRANIQQKNE